MSGATQVVRLLLRDKALCRKQRNAKGDSAEQLAGFCGQYECAAAIKNFVRREAFDVYSKERLSSVQLKECDKISPEACTWLFDFANQADLRPAHLWALMDAFVQKGK